MKFFEAQLTLSLAEPEFAEAYRKAIEGENERYFTENPVYDKEGKLISNEIKPVWSGNYVSIDTEYPFDEDGLDGARLLITVVSRTQPNVEQFIKQYEREGAKLVKKNF